MTRARITASGVLAVVAYIAVASWTFSSGMYPIRPIYEGIGGPLPYRWVTPPPDRAPTNEPPQPGSTDVAFQGGAIKAGSVATGDAQAIVFFPDDAFVPRKGQTAVHIAIDALDPNTIGPPPTGLRYDGNAYRVGATYVPSGRPAALRSGGCGGTQCSIALVYPINASAVYERGPQGWVLLRTTKYESRFSVLGAVGAFGTFVATHRQGAKPKSKIGGIVTFALGLAAILGATMIAARRARTRPPPRPGKRPQGSSTRKKIRTVKRWLRSG